MQMVKHLECLHFLSKTFFLLEGMGDLHNTHGNCRGMGFFVFKNCKFLGGGGACVKFPPLCRYRYFLELHIICFPSCFQKIDLCMNLTQSDHILCM